jgi:hypothetical protein
MLAMLKSGLAARGNASEYQKNQSTTTYDRGQSMPICAGDDRFALTEFKTLGAIMNLVHDRMNIGTPALQRIKVRDSSVFRFRKLTL